MEIFFEKNKDNEDWFAYIEMVEYPPNTIATLKTHCNNILIGLENNNSVSVGVIQTIVKGAEAIQKGKYAVSGKFQLMSI